MRYMEIEINSLGDALYPSPETRELVMNNQTGYFTHKGKIVGGWSLSTYRDLNAPTEPQPDSVSSPESLSSSHAN